MSKLSQTKRAQALMELMRLIDIETDHLNRQRRYVAELKREALKLVRGK